jgi:hypothetical protein
MSVYLDLFPEIAVLRVSGPIRARQIEVLSAGIRRVFDSGVKHLLIDARYAVLDAEAEKAALIAREKLTAYAAQDLSRLGRLVGPHPTFAHYAEIAPALAELQVPNAAELEEWLDAEWEVSRLSEEKTSLLAVLEGKLDQARGASGERARLRILKEGFEKIVGRWAKRVQAWRGLAKKTDPQAVKDLSQAEREVKAQ